MVRRELNILLKRFFLAHPITPMLVTGGLTSSIVCKEIDVCSKIYLSTKALLLLYQFIRAEVTRLMNR